MYDQTHTNTHTIKAYVCNLIMYMPGFHLGGGGSGISHPPAQVSSLQNIVIYFVLVSPIQQNWVPMLVAKPCTKLRFCMKHCIMHKLHSYHYDDVCLPTGKI